MLVFFLGHTFTNNFKKKMENNQEKAKQHLQGELALFENYLLSSSTLPLKNIRTYFTKCAKKHKGVCFNEIV